MKQEASLPLEGTEISAVTIIVVVFALSALVAPIVKFKNSIFIRLPKITYTP